MGADEADLRMPQGNVDLECFAKLELGVSFVMMFVMGVGTVFDCRVEIL